MKIIEWKSSLLFGVCIIILITTSTSSAQVNNTPDTNTIQAKQAGPAPGDVLKKLSDLIHARKYAEAQQSIADLLLVYPNDQRLIKAKALLDKLIAPAGATQGNTQPGSPSGMDKVEYNALLELAREAQQNPDLDQQKASLKQFMDESSAFLQKYPGEMLLWQIRAASAISLKEPAAGYDAGQKLLAAGVADSNDSNVLQLLAKLKLLGWMDNLKIEGLQLNADNERKRMTDSVEAEKLKERLKVEHDAYTLPVLRYHGLTGLDYGHLTINANNAVYEGSDGTINFSKNDITLIKVWCTNGICWMTFVWTQGSNLHFTPVTEDAVIKMTTDGPIYYPPSKIGDMIVKRWHFVPDGRFLNPPTQ